MIHEWFRLIDGTSFGTWSLESLNWTISWLTDATFTDSNHGSTVVNSGWTGWNRGKLVMYYKDKRSVRDLKQYRRNTKCEDTLFWLNIVFGSIIRIHFFVTSVSLKTVWYRLARWWSVIRDLKTSSEILLLHHRAWL